jgi:hypothetical protein
MVTVAPLSAMLSGLALPLDAAALTMETGVDVSVVPGWI